MIASVNGATGRVLDPAVHVAPAAAAGQCAFDVEDRDTGCSGGQGLMLRLVGGECDRW
jgi:hypothetical protein